MKLASKVTIFISSISIVSIILIYIIIKDNYSNLITFENKLVNNEMKSLLDNIDLSNEEIKHTLKLYNDRPEILKILNNNHSIEFQELFVRDNFTNLFLLNEKKEIIKSGVYIRDSEEFYNSNEKSDFFKKNINIENSDDIYFTTYEYEKIIFNILKIDEQNLDFKYIVLGKALDSKFLSFITRLSDNYVSLLFNHTLDKKMK